ncbi:MAG TPA: SRPBCC domain-containing protein [Solirubrobacterales bacterium]|nr:SRPBCC domain-containing protein [Solirubrobacterales bacterium]
MGPIRAETEIDAPRERIYAVLSDLSLRPSFTDHFLGEFRLTRIDASGVGAGVRFRLATPLRSPWADTAIVEVEEPLRIVERGRTGRANRIPTNTVWELAATPGSLTAVRLTHWTEPGNPLDRAAEIASGASFWQGRGWREALRRLRELVEADAPAARIAVAGGNRYATGIP